MSEQSIVRVDHAHKYYNKGRSNEIHVMNDIDLSLPSSGMVAIFGQSGCGKTTLLNAIGGLDRINSGRIEIFGEDLSKDTDTVRNKYIGFIFQNYNLNVSETVLENVSDSLRLCGMTDADEIRERSLAALKNVDMEKYRDRTPDTLSGGQQQRVAIARAIVKSPAIILADEPTGNLDENNTVKVMDILKEISRTRLVILVTHEANLVDYYCDQVIEMSDGQIVNVRENDGANGYIQRNKNDIWLGELEKREEDVPGLKVTCYGDIPADEPVRVRLICENGRLFLKCDTPGVKLLDDSSEITLREGVFRAAREETPEEVRHDEAHLDMSKLTPFEGTVFGRLFHLDNSLTLAWRENFSKKKKKKGKGFLRFCLIALSFVMVFMTAVFSVDIRGYQEEIRDHNEYVFSVPAVVDDNGEFLYDYNGLIRDQVGQHGIDGVMLVSYGAENAKQNIAFDTAVFMTAEAPALKARAYFFSLDFAGDKKLIKGTRPTDDRNDVLITSGLADTLIESSPVSYINDYDDLIGLVTSSDVLRNYYGIAIGGRLRIVGIVESEEQALYMNDLLWASFTINTFYYNTFTAASLYDGYTGAIAKGEAVAVGDTVSKGETVPIFGESFKVTDAITMYYDVSQYDMYWKDRAGEALMLPESYALSKGIDAVPGDKDFLPVFWEWLFDYYPTYLKDFLSSNAFVGNMDLWLYAKKDSIPAYLNFIMNYNSLHIDPIFAAGYDETYEDFFDHAYRAWIFRNTAGEWPGADTTLGKEFIIEDFKNDYYRYEQEFWSTQKYDSMEYTILINDEDYIRLASSVGKSDGRICDSNVFYPIESWDGETYYRSYLLIHSDDPEAAEAYLRTFCASDLITPADTLKEQTGQNMGEVIASVVSILVVAALMCLCVFFIMRASFMSRIKEVGILRAIGVSRSNLLFRFLIETLMLTLMTVGIGYLLAWALESYMEAGVLMSNSLYFPIWIALPMLVLLLAVCVLFGLLPAMLLLRRTPSEILSKYDI
ncbi:MAG: ABC transporter ATP-binding protein/permease [Clostridia bacterium]|nr:ABC transporter ATP-binding protein/permease [Clostridia bacterium]